MSCVKTSKLGKTDFPLTPPKKNPKSIPNENLYSQPHVNVNEKWIFLPLWKKTLFVCCLDLITPLLSFFPLLWWKRRENIYYTEMKEMTCACVNKNKTVSPDLVSIYINQWKPSLNNVLDRREESENRLLFWYVSTCMCACECVCKPRDGDSRTVD